MRTYPTTPMCDGELLAAFEPTTRRTDVFVATVAKSGQTWLLALLHHLRTGGLDPEFGGVGALGVTPWLENPRDMVGGGQLFDRAERLEAFGRMSDPRVFKLHVAWDEIPRAAGSGAKVMTVTRDLRDVPWSMFTHMRSLKVELRGPSAADQGFDPWFETWMERGYAFDMIRTYWQHRQDPDFLWLRYEDMKADLAREARRCVDFLGWTVDDDALARACALCDLGHMQKNESALKLTAFNEPFVREGAVGKNRARLSAEQVARIEDRARRDLDPDCYAFVMGAS